MRPPLGGRKIGGPVRDEVCVKPAFNQKLGRSAIDRVEAFGAARTLAVPFFPTAAFFRFAKLACAIRLRSSVSPSLLCAST